MGISLRFEGYDVVSWSEVSNGDMVMARPDGRLIEVSGDTYLRFCGVRSAWGKGGDDR